MMMKRIVLYAILLSGVASTFSCTKQEGMEPSEVGDKLVVDAALVSSSPWSNSGSGERTTYGVSAEMEGGKYIITAQKEEWGVDSTTINDTPLTRGTPITSSSGIAAMSVSIYRTDEASWDPMATPTSYLISTKDGNSYTTSPAYNWVVSPTTKTTLFAHSPVSGAGNGLTDTGYKIIYDVPTNVKEQPDFCTATPHFDIVNNDGTQHVRTFALQHRLTAVGFRMLGWNLQITDITISGVSMQGTFDMSSSSWGSLTSVGSRSVGVTKNSFLHDHTSDYADITTSDGYLMMIPQTLTDEAMVTINYTATTADATSGTLTAKLKDLAVSWGAGDWITYNIRLKTAPAVTSGDLQIETPEAGYTTTSPVSLVMDNLDRLTFSWSESWLKVYRGNPTSGTQPAGSASPWSVGPGGPWSNIYFYATDANPSTLAERSALVTVTGTRSGTKTFYVKQAKNKPSAGDYTTTPANSYIAYLDGSNTVKFDATKKPRSKTSGLVGHQGYLKGTQSGTSNYYDGGKYTSGKMNGKALTEDLNKADIAKIEVVWQTLIDHGKGIDNGTQVFTSYDANAAGKAFIKDISYDASTGYCTVLLNGTGNALIAAYDSQNTILWSWHIWGTDTKPEATIDPGNSVNGAGKKFMDRNLGALSSTATQPTAEGDAYKYFGLLYQWGRKEPFTGAGPQYTSKPSGEVNSIPTAIFDKSGIYMEGQGTKPINKTTGGYTRSRTSAPSTYTLLSNPTTHYNGPDAGIVITDNPNTWTAYNSTTVAKSIYDPCPYGYRVPKNGSWSGFTANKWTEFAITGGASWKNSWWPAAGYRTNAILYLIGSNGYYWSSSPSANASYAYNLNFYYNNGVYPSNANGRSYSMSVRCVEE